MFSLYCSRPPGTSPVPLFQHCHLYHICTIFSFSPNPPFPFLFNNIYLLYLNPHSCTSTVFFKCYQLLVLTLGITAYMPGSCVKENIHPTIYIVVSEALILEWGLSNSLYIQPGRRTMRLLAGQIQARIHGSRSFSSDPGHAAVAAALAPVWATQHSSGSAINLLSN